LNFTGTIDTFLIGGFAGRGAWGLWVLSSPAATKTTASWSNLSGDRWNALYFGTIMVFLLGYAVYEWRRQRRTHQEQ
jgi:hypothetical protein